MGAATDVSEVLPSAADELSLREDRIEQALRDGAQALRNKHSAGMVVGREIQAISDGGLHKEHGTIEQYGKQRWGIGRSRLYQLKDAAALVDEMSTTVDKDDLPIIESQVRPLLKLSSPEQRTQAWKAAVKNNGIDKVTAKHVAAEVEALRKPGENGTTDNAAKPPTNTNENTDGAGDESADADSPPDADDERPTHAAQAIADLTFAVDSVLSMKNGKTLTDEQAESAADTCGQAVNELRQWLAARRQESAEAATAIHAQELAEAPTS